MKGKGYPVEPGMTLKGGQRQKKGDSTASRPNSYSVF